MELCKPYILMNCHHHQISLPLFVHSLFFLFSHCHTDCHPSIFKTTSVALQINQPSTENSSLASPPPSHRHARLSIVLDLTAITLASGAVIPMDAATTVEAAVETIIETESCIEGTITNADGISYTFLVHFVLKRAIGQRGTCLSPSKSRRFGYSYRTLDTCDDTIKSIRSASPPLQRDHDYFSASVTEARCDPIHGVGSLSCVHAYSVSRPQMFKAPRSVIAISQTWSTSPSTRTSWAAGLVLRE
ncbi:hypothetical protein B0T13DRAFT_171961 [Neurospora crassa]|nr:hypothetical protein B0T13DRAFT_171961 [Neurospora crassa]